MKQRVLSLLKCLFLCALVYFFWEYYDRHSEEFHEVLQQYQRSDLLIAFFWIASGYAVIALLWSYLLYFFTGVRIAVRDGFGATTISWLGKYIPGKIWMVGMRAYYSKGEKLSVSDISFLTIFDAVYFHLCGIFLALALAPFTVFWFYLPLSPYYYFLGFFLCLLILHPKVWKGLLTRLTRSLGVALPLSGCRYWHLLLIFFVNSFSYLFWTMGLILLLPHDLSPSFFDTLSIFVGVALAYVGGFFVLLAPAGFGVRDGILALTVQECFALSMVEGLTVAAAFRLVSTASELFLAALGYLFVKLKSPG